MRTTRLRPTFELRRGGDVDQFMTLLRGKIRGELKYGRAISAGRCIEFFVEDEDKKLWSPYLSVQAHQDDNEVVLHCRFSPAPDVWTFIMMFYAGNACLIAFGLILSYVQLTLQYSPWGIACVIVGLACIASVHVSSMVGQNATHDQMQQLRHNLDVLIGKSEHDQTSD